MKEVIIKALEIKDIVQELPRWGKFHQRMVGSIDKIVVHHSAAAQSLGLTPFNYAHFHKNKMGAPGVCYHYSINPEGEVFKCNEHTDVVWACGNANYSSINIELDGHFEVEQPTDKQLASLRILNKKLMEEIETIKDVVGHNEVNATLCPGENMKERKSEWTF